MDLRTSWSSQSSDFAPRLAWLEIQAPNGHVQRRLARAQIIDAEQFSFDRVMAQDYGTD
jgi:hypothetical protein